MSDCLHRIRVKKDASLPQKFPDFSYRLDYADFIIATAKVL
jgi:hypothetical protein